MRLIDHQLQLGIAQAKIMADMSPDPWKKVGVAGFDKWGSFVASGNNHIGVQFSHPVLQDRELRRPLMIHAEIDLLSQKKDVSIIVITLFPCVPCMNALAAFRVHTVYYMEMYEKDKEALLVAAFHGITCIKI